MGGVLQPSRSAPTTARAICRALASAELPLLARTQPGDDTTDLAIALRHDRLAVLRCIDRSTVEDHSALATMISEGDFIYGAVVYEEGEPPQSPGLIESFHVSQLDQLVARLIELREACCEAD